MGTQTGSYDKDGGHRYRRLRPGPGLSRGQVAADQQARLRRAVIEIVATDGYEALTVRGLTKRARISSGTLYKHYCSTDDCFLSTFDLICRHAAKRMTEACQDERERRRGLAVAIERLLQDMADAPQAATFMLRAAPAAGPAFADRLWDSAMQLGLALEPLLSTEGRPLPRPLLEAIVAGLTRIGRVRVQALARPETRTVTAEMVEWMTSLGGSPIQGASPVHAPIKPARKGDPSPAAGLDGGWMEPLGDDRAMILAATFRIARSGYHQLSVPRICREAGVARRDFNRHFSGLEDCFLSALEERVARTVAVMARRPPESATKSGVPYIDLETLCEALEDDVDGARVLLVEITAAGTAGIDSRDRQISQIATAWRALAPQDRRPSAIAAEASTAAAWAAMQRWASGSRFGAANALLPVLASLMEIKTDLFK